MPPTVADFGREAFHPFAWQIVEKAKNYNHISNSMMVSNSGSFFDGIQSVCLLFFNTAIKQWPHKLLNMWVHLNGCDHFSYFHHMFSFDPTVAGWNKFGPGARTGPTDHELRSRYSGETFDVTWRTFNGRFFWRHVSWHKRPAVSRRPILEQR